MKHWKSVFLGIGTAFLVMVLSFPAMAVPKKFMEAVRDAYPPGEPHRGFETAYEDLDPNKLRGFIVVQQGGIPAERARFFISWDDYDYRGATIHLDEQGRISTRIGSVYAYLQRGDVMTVADVKQFGDVVYLNLITPDVYIPDARGVEKRHSRVTVGLGFEIPKSVVKSGDADELLRLMAEWVKPFKNKDDADRYARELTGSSGIAVGATENATPTPTKGKKTKAVTPAAASVAPATSPTTVADDAVATSGTSADSARVQSLEEKIEKARQEIDQAQKEINQMKQDDSGRGGRRR